MRMLHVVDSLKVGGAEMLLYSLASRYLEEGHQIEVAYFTPGELLDEFQNLNIPIHRISKFGVKDPLALFRLAKIIHQFQPDVIHTHLFKSDLIGQIAARITNVPVRVSSVHNNDPWRKNPIYTSIMRRVIHSCHCIIAVSPDVYDYTARVGRYPENKMVAIDNGINLDKFDPENINGANLKLQRNIPETAPLIGTIGRLQPQKAQHIFLEAAEITKKECPDTYFLIVGDGPLRKELEAIAGEQVILAGILRNIPEVLSQMTIFSLSSAWEGLPVAMLEAMAMARPVVVTAVGGIPSAIEHNENGLLVTPNDPAALAEAWITLLRDREHAHKLGLNARETIRQRYSEESMHRQIMQIYETHLRLT